MAVGVDIITTSGRLIFELERGEDKTTRTLDIPSPITTPEDVQLAINAAESIYTDASNGMQYFMQTANWRDNNNTELQWRTTHVRYEIVTTAITPVEPDEVVSRQMTNEEQQQEREERGERHEQEQNDQQKNEPQGEWQG